MKIIAEKYARRCKKKIGKIRYYAEGEVLPEGKYYKI
jgi:hypothetical protein